MKPKWKDMACLFLTGFEAEPINDPRLDISPTMKNVTYEGRRYFRMDSSFRILDDGSRAAVYLWEGWADAFMKRGQESAGAT